ncbi:ATP-binding protein, partial [Lactobacillus mellis]|nr:ATP-binding protein [Bombilactobacillus mellis]
MLQVPENINKRYNHALSIMKPGQGTLVGNQEQLGMLTDALLRLETPSAILLGEQGVGKTALVEQWL